MPESLHANTKNPNINVETLRLMKKREKKNKKRRQLRRKNKEAVKQKKQAIEKEDGNKILNITMKEFLPAETISHAAVDNSIGNAARYLLLDNFIKYSQGIKAFIKNNLGYFVIPLMIFCYYIGSRIFTKLCFNNPFC